MTTSVNRVLMTCDAMGGVWTYAVDLSRALGDMGIEVVLAVMGRPLSDAQHREIWGIPTLTVLEGAYKLEWMVDPWLDVERAGQWLLGLEQRYSPDLVHLNGYAHGALPFAAPTLMVGHSCVLSWWQAVKGERAPAEWDTYRERVSAGLHAADFVVTPTVAMLEVLEQLYGRVPRSAVIRHGLDLGRYQPDLKEPFVFAAGRVWDAARNVAALARAAGAIGWPVYVAGDAQRSAGNKVEGMEEGVERRVRALGPLSRGELARWLGRAAIYALPARYEPFGLTVLEAAAAGCALVLGDIPSLRELWEGSALFVPPEDDALLARTLGQLASNRQQREDCAARAYARAQRYSRHALRTNYSRLYEMLLAQHHNHITQTLSVRPDATEPRSRRETRP